MKEAELKTSGEIVPMIVKSSSTVGHVPIVIFLIALLFYFMVDLAQFGYFESSTLNFLIWAILCLPVSRLLAELSLVQRLLVNQMDQRDQVELRAEVEFYEANLKNTEGSTGILLFVSLMERKAVVLADEAIAKQLPSETWNEVVLLLVDGARKKSLSQGFCMAIDRCGNILAEHFPIDPNDNNELPNTFIIKE